MDLMAKSNRHQQVKQSILLLVLMATCTHAAIATDLEGSEYRNWCRQHAFADKIPSEEQNEYVTACIKRLVDADNRPQKTPDDETERQTGDN
jgi:hypothetical protein